MSKLELANVLAIFSRRDECSKNYLERKRGKEQGGQEDGAVIFAQLPGRGTVSEAVPPGLAQEMYAGPLFSFLGPLTLAWTQTLAFPSAPSSGLEIWS